MSVELSAVYIPVKSESRYDAIIARLHDKPRAPHNVQWSDVKYNVGQKTILTDCWGDIPSGKTCAILGSSGAGKSSLLNVLAGRICTNGKATVSGNFCVGGTIIDPVAFRNNIAYVMQEDSLLATATPREALEFSASLRLPSSTSPETIKELVDAMIEELGLEDCADTMIGGPLITGISGGQKKRTMVAVEIITNPSLLFLDEPTSGLDSFSAYACVALLKKVASHDTTVLCTIHQPSSEVFFLFDLVIVMKSGRVFFQGPVEDLSIYLNKFEYVCPTNFNPADYVLYILQTESLDSLDSREMFMQKPDIQFESTMIAAQSSNKSINGLLEPVLISRAASIKQLRWLTWREFLNTTRDTAALGSRFGVTIMMNLLFGLIFFNAGNKDDSVPNNFNAHLGVVTMISMASMLTSAQPVMLHFPYERPMFLREYSTGTYGAIPYFISKALVELPLTFMQSIVQQLLVYFLVHRQGNFILFVLIAWGLGITASSVAVLLGCIMKDVKSVTELAPLTFIPQILFAGFFIRTSQIPIYLRWAQYLCALKYAMNVILLIEFNPDNNSCSGSVEPVCKGVLENNDIHENDWWVYILLLLVLFFGFRCLGAIFLVYKANHYLQ